MTADEAIIRAAECAREDQHTYYVYRAGPQHFVSPHLVLGDGTRDVIWEIAAHPDGRVTLNPEAGLDEICRCGAGLNTTGECEVENCPVAPQAN